MIKNYLIVSLLCCFLGFSQFNSSAPWMTNVGTTKNGEATIDEIVTAFNTYWLSRDKKARGAGYKPFMRWEYHWRNYANDCWFLFWWRF